MISSRLSLLLTAGFCLLRAQPLLADDIPSPFGTNPQYSADLTVTTDKGQSITQKMSIDSGKVRMDMSVNAGGQTIQVGIIIRPDLKKIYQLAIAQKIVMETPYNPKDVQDQMDAATGPKGKYEVVGPDPVGTEACTKYKITTPDNKVAFLWVDATSKTPVKMTDSSNDTLTWKNFKSGPQDPAIFEVPAGFKLMANPNAPPPDSASAPAPTVTPPPAPAPSEAPATNP